MPTSDEIKQFSSVVSNMVATKNMRYMDAILLYCEQTGFEIELAATLLTPAIRSHLEEEAEAANLIKRTNRLTYVEDELDD